MQNKKERLIETVSEKEMNTLFKSEKYLNWYSKLEKMNITVNKITVIKVHLFGKNLGFAHLVVDATGKDEKFIPGITVIRGDSVFMLTILTEEETGMDWYVLTHQPRVPAGEFIYEVPAGMIDDDSGNVEITALKEIVEEVGEELKPSLSDLRILDRGAYTSPGLIDEKGKIFVFKKTLPKKIIDSLRNKRTGLEEEDITLRLVKKEEFLKTVDSMAAKLAFYQYQEL